MRIYKIKIGNVVQSGYTLLKKKIKGEKLIEA